MRHHLPERQGLYDPAMEKDSCGVGAVAFLTPGQSHEVVEKALTILRNLRHRGATGSDPGEGDGSGIMTDLPHGFFKAVLEQEGILLPEAGTYAAGMLFLPKEPAARLYCEGVFERMAREEGFEVLGWREVPQGEAHCGKLARATRPDIVQVFLGTGGRKVDERTLLILRKRVQAHVAQSGIQYTEKFYVCSLSGKTIVYKGLVPGPVLAGFYPDLQDPRYETRVALVHERYSTNTFPSWELAHPFRFCAHNGEINTLSGNVNWMKAREGVMTSDVFGPRLEAVLPVVEPGGSDSAAFDNVLEFLMANGHEPAKSLSIMVPKAWQANPGLEGSERAFYAYHARFMEPWDGPASIIAYDGRRLCAVRDKNGLRPLRYDIDNRNLLVMASESGVVESRGILKEKGGLAPGDVICFDLEKDAFSDGPATLKRLAREQDYEAWIRANRMTLGEIRRPSREAVLSEPEMYRQMALFGYGRSEVAAALSHMADTGREPTVSMGIDRPLPALSSENHLLFDYFKHRFAQVTNPPMDPIREKCFTSLEQVIGFPGNRADIAEVDSRMPFIGLPGPILDDEAMAGLKLMDQPPFKAAVIPMQFPAEGDPDRLEKAVEDLKHDCERCVQKGYTLLILSDRQTDLLHAPIPSLLAVSAVHHHLVEKKLRTRADLLVETGEVRDVSQAALLLGYGAKAVNPWLAMDWIRKRAEKRQEDPTEAIRRFQSALDAGLLKIIAKMGITTLQAYQGAKLFEAVGVSEAFLDAYFESTPSRLGGVDLLTVQKETVDRHSRAYESASGREGLKQPKPVLYDRQTVERLGSAAETGDYALFKSVSDDLESRIWSIRSLLEPAKDPAGPRPCLETEEAILGRFSASAMSYGSISPEAHVAIGRAMNRLGAISNSGEGGEKDALRDVDARSGIRQVASGRFGVDVAYVSGCREIEIKVAQGAKPGEGGHLPPGKVTEEIARVRNAKAGISLISPPPHHDIYSIEDLAQLIHDLRQVNPEASISVKLVASAGIGTVAAGVAKAGADKILISGGNGGTGAAPLSSTRSAGIPWEIGLAEVHQTLLLNNLRHLVELKVDGKLLTGRDVVKACMLGAESFGFATALLIAMGCRMCRQCQKNVCPAGIATQDKHLREAFKGTPGHVERYMRFVAREVKEILQAHGYESLEAVLGRTDLLRIRQDLSGKAKALDLGPILFRPELPGRIQDRRIAREKPAASSRIDMDIAEEVLAAIEAGRTCRGGYAVTNRDRGIGTCLSGRIARAGLADRLEEGAVELVLTGSAGQSLGAFLTKGITLRVYGDVNDYAGKSLSGGRIVITPEKEVEGGIENGMIAGNTVLYGASGGTFYGAGVTGDRFAVRNSGALAVCEGLGNNGCEYMTGGTVVVLGDAGLNLGAGMSGGRIFLLGRETAPESGGCASRPLRKKEGQELHGILSDYAAETGSPKARGLLEAWSVKAEGFRVVEPVPPKEAEAGGKTGLSA